MANRKRNKIAREVNSPIIDEMENGNLESPPSASVPASTKTGPPSPDDDGQLEDPLCCAKSAKKITFQDVTTAAFLIKGGVECTPCTV